MSSRQALTKLGESTGEACLSVLEMFAADKVSMGEVTTFDDPKSAFAGAPVPCVAMSVSYVDGVTGGNVFLITLDGARNLAASMMGMDAPEDPDAEELSELELSAVSEAMNQMMASAAAATSVVLGMEVEIGTPDTKMFTAASEMAGAYPATPHAVRIAMSVCGEPARLVQLVPSAFVVRMSSALDDIGSGLVGEQDLPSNTSRGPSASKPSLAGIPVRVWAELGRARMPSAKIVGLPPVRSSNLTGWRTTPSICTSMEPASPPAVWSWWTARTGPCASSTSSRTQTTVKWRWPDGPNPGSRRCRLHAEDGL